MPETSRSATRTTMRTYSAHRLFADAQWDVLRFNADAQPFSCRVAGSPASSFRGNGPTNRLIPGEQFGLGGARSIRGLDERELIADSGLRTGFEVWSEPIPFTQGLRVLGFVDFGYFDRSESLPFETNTDTITSAGIGLRWQWQSLSLETNYGHDPRRGPGFDRDERGYQRKAAAFQCFLHFLTSVRLASQYRRRPTLKWTGTPSTTPKQRDRPRGRVCADG